MGDNNNYEVKVPVKMKRVVSICLSVGLSVCVFVYMFECASVSSQQ